MRTAYPEPWSNPWKGFEPLSYFTLIAGEKEPSLRLSLSHRHGYRALSVRRPLGLGTLETETTETPPLSALMAVKEPPLFLSHTEWLQGPASQDTSWTKVLVGEKEPPLIDIHAHVDMATGP